MRMTPQDWALLVLLSMLWGGSFLFATVAVRDLPPLTVVVLRTGLAALALLLVLRARNEPTPFAKGITSAFVVMGLLNNLLPFTLLFWAQTVIPGGLASILNATTPIFSIIVAHFLLSDERMTPNRVAGILFGLSGVAVLIGGDVWTGADAGLAGMLACLGAALCYGFAGVYGRRFKPMRLSAPQVAFGQLAATTVIAIPLVLAIDRPLSLPMPGLPAVGSVLALAILSTALAYVIFFRILASAGAVNVALVTLLVPVSAILLGTLILGEALLLRHYAGMGLIGIGLLAMDGRLANRGRAGNRP
jgi:drug/metabolite transporter (DMT)-like permease